MTSSQDIRAMVTRNESSRMSTGNFDRDYSAVYVLCTYVRFEILTLSRVSSIRAESVTVSVFRLLFVYYSSITNHSRFIEIESAFDAFGFPSSNNVM